MNHSRTQKESKGTKLPDDWYEQLKHYGRFLAKNDWDGEDLVQEAAAKAYQHYPAHDITMALLRKMTYHLWIDTIRKRRKEELRESPLPLFSNETQFSCDDWMESIEELLSKLTPKQAVIFFLKETFQYQAKEIAEALDSSEEAVKAGLMRARNRLRKQQDEGIKLIDQDINEEVYSLFYEALKLNDPTRLLQALPAFEVFAAKTLSNTPTLSLVAA